MWVSIAISLTLGLLCLAVGIAVCAAITAQRDEEEGERIARRLAQYDYRTNKWRPDSWHPDRTGDNRP